MIEVALYQPEIPPNTGNIIRLCANTGAPLHLIEPLGFRIDDASVKRAGLDYHEMVNVTRHASLDALRAARPDARWLAFSTRSTQRYDQFEFRDGDILLFGPETRGLPDDVLDSVPETQRLRLPMRPGNRSLNLSNAVAVGVYEAWRQFGFA
ncbi:tRNA (cytidine(34)-2'-O)-methyltransferase [Solimonas marina]|uniref:tRNA (cytidine(34)-2'-O)-methyltransferase n=1 Tax=Solimonas marina TaxID=2714601 RepID=A0A969W4T4_9GAMM|nr:tRNA (cytidine(34)-2'-O)-methyltransferase [Solimonas marina]NKF20696.1 tRNA (cytidine(34)-2'-O)-methyltransferase [Solimonas marina]